MPVLASSRDENINAFLKASFSQLKYSEAEIPAQILEFG